MTEEENKVWMPWELWGGLGQHQTPNFSFLIICLRFFSSCPLSWLSTKESSQWLPLWSKRNLLCRPPPAPSPYPTPWEPGCRRPSCGLTCPSLWLFLLGSVLSLWLYAEWCLQVLPPLHLCISMPTVTLLNLFSSLRPVELGLCAAFRLTVHSGFSMFALPAFSGSHRYVSCASIWPVMHVLNSYLHSLSPF